MKTHPKTQTPITVWSLIPLALAAVLVLTGCVVTSVYPYYHPKDLVFEAALLGVWVDAKEEGDKKETWTFEQLDHRTYKLITSDGNKQTEFDARLFKLKGERFLDCLPRERPDNTAPLHFLMRVDSLTPQFQLRLLNYDWLGKLVQKQPRAIRHTVVPKKAGDGDGGDLVLTADTDELQKFVVRHLSTSEAWSEPVALKRR